MQMSKPDTPSRWILYHGTSTARLRRILADGILRISPTGDRKVSLTTERSVAEYFACNAVFGDERNYRGEESKPVVLALDGEGLLELNYDLTPFNDPVYGEGECEWENEIACWADIELDEILIGVEPVAVERLRDYREGGNNAFRPSVPAIAGAAFTAMKHAIDKLVEGETRPEKVDKVAAAVRGLHQALEAA